MEKIRIIVAEDEKLIREGIIKSISWEDLGAEIVGQAKNGVQALRLLKEEQADILITDIKMGGGDGLTLIKEAKMINPGLNVIIISGFNNFEYAQRAIKLGVQDYLLKPVVIGDLEKILEKVIDRIKSEADEKKDRDLQNMKFEKNKQILVNQFYRELVYGVIPAQDIPAKAMEYEADCSALSYRSVSLFLEVGDTLKWTETQNRLAEVFTPLCDRRSLTIESVLLTPDELYHSDVTMILSSMKDRIAEEGLMGEISSLFEGTRDMTPLAIGIGPSVDKPEALGLSYQTGRTQAYFSLISGLNSKNGKTSPAPQDLPFNIFETSRELFSIFKNADRQKLNLYLSGIESLAEDEQVDEEARTAIIRNHLVCILSAGDEMGIAVKEFFPDLMVLFRYINLKSLTEMTEKLRWACETIMSQQQTREDKVSINLMDRAKSIILKQFADPLLSLDAISSELGITPAYFSKLYKESQGMSYIEYLTSLRMDKARELLANDRKLKISAVAFMVGYNSSSYFNYIFKKTYGVTPKEFQTRR